MTFVDTVREVRGDKLSSIAGFCALSRMKQPASGAPLRYETDSQRDAAARRQPARPAGATALETDSQRGARCTSETDSQWGAAVAYETASGKPLSHMKWTASGTRGAPLSFDKC